MAHRATVNQQVQIGPETTPGTSVAAGKLLKAFNWSMGAKPTTKQFTGTGAKYPSASEEMTEEGTGKITGECDYNAMQYPISSVFGKVTATLHSTATTAYDWKWTPILSGVQNPQTYTLQQGDGTTEAEQYAYVIFTGFGYSMSRKDAISVSGDWFSQAITTGITMTASPTTIVQYPMIGKHFNVYLDITSANIGTTQLSNPLNVDFAASGYYTEFWPLNRANASFTSAIDAAPKCELKIKLEADSNGITALTYLQSGQRVYVRVDGVGQLIENDQVVSVGAASGGTYTLTYKGQTTTAIAYNASAATVQSALRALSTIGSTGCSVTGTGPWTVLMTGALANDTTALTINGGGLTGGTPTVTAQPIYAAMRHDMCVFVSDISPFEDSDGVYAVEYTFQVAEDTAWASGQSQVLTLTNLQSAL